MKKKESLKELLDRLDEQSAMFNSHLAQANHFFDTASKKMEELLDREKKDLQATIRQVKKALKVLKVKKNKKERAGKN